MKKLFAIAALIVCITAGALLTYQLTFARSSASYRLEFMQYANRLSAGRNPWFGRQQIAELQNQLAASSVPEREEVLLRFRLADELLRVGRTQEAIDQCEKAIALANGHRIRLPDDYQARLGLAYMRLAEETNCIELHNRDCCVFPLAGSGLHQVTGPAEQAKRYFLSHLESQPDDLKRQWLLNIAAMALGQYPEAVPESFRIPPESLESEADIGRFVNIAFESGVDRFNLCGGAIAEDFDNDGLIDIVTSSFDPTEPLAMFRNNGLGQFDDVSISARLDDQLGGLNCIAGDYDNDGDMDILVLRGAWLMDDGKIRNSLLQNDGKGVFVDVTKAAGLANNQFPTQAATWGDFDNDGLLDLYIGNESRPNALANFPSELYRNNGDGTFTDIARMSGVANDRYCKGVTAGDYDNDGDLDLYVSNIGRNRLYQNQGNGTFRDVADEAGVIEPSRRSFATWFFDYDNDGWLDLFVTAYEADVSDIAADYMGKPHQGASPKLYRNNQDGTFSDVTAATGLDHPSLPMGANFGDLDNDGWLDIFLTTGDPDYATLTPSVMLRNDVGQQFQNVTTSGGFGHLQKGHGVAFADFDHDGDQDIYNQLGGFYPGDKFRNALYRNPGHDHRFVTIKLVGSQSNRLGYGARIKVVADGPEGRVELHRAVGSVSSFGGSTSRQEIGLGSADRIERLEIDWPTSGVKQVFEDVPIDSLIQITEGRQTIETLPLQRFQLGENTTGS